MCICAAISQPFLSRHTRHTTLFTNEEGAMHDVRDERKKAAKEDCYICSIISSS